MYLITYTGTHAFILNHNKHITITYLRIFRNSYNRFTYTIILVTYLCLFRSLVYGTKLILGATYTYSDLILMADLFLFRSPVGHIIILISRMTHTYSDSSYTALSLYLYLYLSPVGNILILISYRTPTYTYHL